MRSCLCLLLYLTLSVLPSFSETQIAQDLEMFKSYQTWSKDSVGIYNDATKEDRLVRIQTREGTFHFEMAPNDLRASNYRAESTGADGVRRLVPYGSIETFVGKSIEYPFVSGRFTITPDHFEGVIFTPGNWTFIEPASRYAETSSEDQFIVYRQSDIKPGRQKQCGVPSMLQQGKDQIGSTISTVGQAPVYKVQIATEADPSIARPVLRSRLDPVTVNLKILQILNYVEGLYERELLITFEVTYQHYWSDSSNSPYNGLSTAHQFLNAFADHWNVHFRPMVDYDIAHIWYGSFSDGVVGRAFQGTVCSNPNKGYAATNWLVTENLYEIAFTTAHEIGHNFSADHPNEQSPPIAACRKTLMDKSSYLQSFTFCQYSRDQIREHVGTYNSCLEILESIEPSELEAPYELTSKALGPYRVLLEWKDDNGQAANGFDLERFDAYEGWVFLARLNLNQKQFVDGSVQSGVRYTYRVFAYDREVRSPESNQTEILLPTASQTNPDFSNRWIIPTTVHATGRFGGIFKTRVVLATRDQTAGIRARLYGPKGFEEERPIGMNQFSYWPLDDFFMQVFKKKGGGAVELIGDNPFHVGSVEVYIDTENGRNFTPVMNQTVSVEPYQGVAYNYGVTVDDSTRVNLGAFNDSDTSQVIRVEIKTGEESYARSVHKKSRVETLGSVTFNLPAKGWMQKSLPTRVENGYLVWTVPQEAYLYMVSVDNKSNDGNLVYPVKGN